MIAVLHGKRDLKEVLPRRGPDESNGARAGDTFHRPTPAHFDCRTMQRAARRFLEFVTIGVTGGVGAYALKDVV